MDGTRRWCIGARALLGRRDGDEMTDRLSVRSAGSCGPGDTPCAEKIGVDHDVV